MYAGDFLDQTNQDFAPEHGHINENGVVFVSVLETSCVQAEITTESHSSYSWLSHLNFCLSSCWGLLDFRLLTSIKIPFSDGASGLIFARTF